MDKVNFYIGGFNIYHAIDKMKDNKLKWINYKLLCQKLLKPNEIINQIFYFSAYATWKQSSFLKHRVFVRALKTENINIILGNFKNKTKYIPNINYNYKYHEEKESDVNIAIHLVRDACRKNCYTAIILSGDSDLVPAIKMAKNVQADSLKKASDFNRKLSEFPLSDFLFPKNIILDNKNIISCPSDWI